jgi:hypothetical protein
VKRCCDLELIFVVKLCWMHVCESTSEECSSELKDYCLEEVK